MCPDTTATPATGLRPHPQRQLLNDEVHARPSVALDAPSRITSLTFWFAPGDGGGQREALARLTARLGLPAPGDATVQYHGGHNGLRITWSLHTEFARYSFIVDGAGTDPFADTALSHVPSDWLDSVPGQLLMAMHTALLPPTPPGTPVDIRALSARWFEGNELIGADISEGEALALTDLRLHEDPDHAIGFTRLLILDQGLKPRTGGRMVTRLFEIESYRMLALLALPLAKTQMRALDALDAEIKRLTRKMTTGAHPDSELLEQLNRLAAELEDRRSDTQYRFSAAHAYYRLIVQRIEELRERRRPGLQPFKEFVQRRLGPAIDTCGTVERRQADLAARLQRSSALLRTRVEIEQEQQNQLLLASMNRRSALQLRLQKTVEGLSVGVLTYYAVALISYGAKALKSLGVPLNPDLCAGAAIPVIGLVVWLTVHKIKREH